jgi:hypothetical protein
MDQVICVIRDQSRITEIQLFQFDVPSCYRYGEGVLTDCHYGLLKMTCGDHTGWSECIMSANDAKHFDLVQWSSFLQLLKKPTLPEAFETMNHLRETWGETKTELIRIALLDLSARAQSKKLFELLLPGKRFWWPLVPARGLLSVRNKFISTPALSAHDEYPEPEPLRTRRDTSYGTGFQLNMNTLIKECHAYYAVL